MGTVAAEAPGGAGAPVLALEVQRLEKRFGTFVALAGLDFTVGRGEIFGLLGPNGSGKTTALNLISGLAEPSGGSVRVFGLDPRRQAAEARRLLGVVPQETALYEELTAERNLAFHAELFGIPAAERPRRIAAMLDLARLAERAHSRVATFSGGMKRRLAIARALLHDPQLVYLDEPTLGVDVQARRAIWDHILDMKRGGRTVLLTTNYLEEANALCDRLAIIDRGRLVALDAPAALKARYGESVVEAELDRDAPADLLASLRDLPGVREVAAEGPRLSLSLGGAADEAGHPGAAADGGAALGPFLDAVLRCGCAVRHLALREPALDEVFLALTGRGLRD